MGVVKADLKMKGGDQGLSMRVFRPRLMKRWAQVLVCLLMLGLLQPNLVMCTEADGGVKLETGSHSPLPFSDPLSGAACAGKSQAETSCDDCIDTPVFTAALIRGFSEIESATLLKLAAHTADNGDSLQISTADLNSPSPLHIYHVKKSLRAIQSTRLLI
jgi:hypothetical protein